MPVQENDKSIVLNHPTGATVEIQLFGATITSWRTAGKERLFLSSKAHMDGSAAIRGGIPVVFPIFGPPPSSPPEYAALKQHGFVRTETWKLERVLLDRDEAVSVRLVAPPAPASFGHQFELHYVVTLAAHQIVCDLHVLNTGSVEFKFQALLHNYIRVPDISKVRIAGLGEGTSYKDKVRGGEAGTAPDDTLVIDRETDRVYAKVPSREIKLDDGTDKYKIRFRGFEDCVIWNPGQSGTKIADMEDGGWNHYVCIEPGYVSEFKTIKPAEQFIGQQTISLL